MIVLIGDAASCLCIRRLLCTPAYSRENGPTISKSIFSFWKNKDLVIQSRSENCDFSSKSSI